MHFFCKQKKANLGGTRVEKYPNKHLRGTCDCTLFLRQSQRSADFSLHFFSETKCVTDYIRKRHFFVFSEGLGPLRAAIARPTPPPYTCVVKHMVFERTLQIQLVIQILRF